MILRRLATLLLALALLAGWQEALQHPLRHAASAKVSQQGGNPLCEQHAALDTVLGAIGCAAPAMPGAPPAAQRVASFAAAPASPSLVYPSSRDPPVLL